MRGGVEVKALPDLYLPTVLVGLRSLLEALVIPLCEMRIATEVGSEMWRGLSKMATILHTDHSTSQGVRVSRVMRSA